MSELKIGLVGAGHITISHLEGWRRAGGCRVTGIHDRDHSAAERRALQFGVDQVQEDLESLLATSDAVDVCTPPDTHADIARQVIAAGRHLLIEKPLVTRLAEWEEIRGLIEQHPVKVAVVHNLKFSRAIQTAKLWLEEGRLGRVIRLTRHFLTDEESDRMLTARRHWSHGLPGGRWFETLPHALYLMHHLVGPLELDHVAALHTPHAPPGAPADEVMITLRGHDCLATIHYSASCRLNKRQLVVHGTEGVVTVDVLSDSAILSTRRDGRWLRAGAGTLLDSGSELLRWLPDRSRYLADRVRGETAHARLIEAFARHLQGDGPSPTPLEEVDYVIRSCDQIGGAIEARLREVGLAQG